MAVPGAVAKNGGNASETGLPVSVAVVGLILTPLPPTPPPLARAIGAAAAVVAAAVSGTNPKGVATNPGGGALLVLVWEGIAGALTVGGVEDGGAAACGTVVAGAAFVPLAPPLPLAAVAPTPPVLDAVNVCAPLRADAGTRAGTRVGPLSARGVGTATPVLTARSRSPTPPLPLSSLCR